jgi:hypothetical protein
MRKLVLRRWYCWLPALLVAAGLGYVGYRVMHPPWEGTEAWEKYQRLRLGMTEDEVEAVMGSLPEWEFTPYPSAAIHQTGTWTMGDDRIGVQLSDGAGSATKPTLGAKWARIQGREFTAPRVERYWWHRLRDRLGW